MTGTKFLEIPRENRGFSNKSGEIVADVPACFHPGRDGGTKTSLFHGFEEWQSPNATVYRKSAI